MKCFFLWLAIVMGCAKEEAPLRFAPFQAPSGVPEPQTIKDEAIDQPGHVGMETVLVVPADIQWEQLDRLLGSIGRQARARQGFKHAPHAQFADIRVYDNVAKTDDNVAYVGRVQIRGGEEPTIENRLPFPLGETVTKMVAARPEYGTIKPKAESVDSAGKLVISVPFIVEGEDHYREKVDFGLAMQEFDSWALQLFRKLPALRDFTFVGEHQEKELIRIQLTRAQYEQINIAKVEEDLGAFSGEFLVGQMQGAISDQVVAKKLAAKRRGLYGAMLKQLPADQVVISKSLPGAP